MLTNFNAEQQLNLKYRTEVEKYFDYRWAVDLNLYTRDSEYWLQLPDATKETMYVEFLWDRFIKVHHATFGNLYKKSENKFSFYTWQDEQYRSFMLEVLQALEPRIEPANTIIFDEL